MQHDRNDGDEAKDRDAIMELLLKSGEVTEEQLADARGLVTQMGALGVQRDLLGALVDRTAITGARAEEIREQAGQQAEQKAEQKAPDAEDAIEVAEDVPMAEEAELVAPDELLKVASHKCANHPRVNAAGECYHCRRPICDICLVRMKKGTYCSDACLRGAFSVAGRFHYVLHSIRSMRIGRVLAPVAGIAVVLAVAWGINHVIEEYRYSSAIESASEPGASRSEAIEGYELAVSLRPHSTEARVGLAGALLESSQLGKAMTQLDAVLEAAPDNPDALRLLTQVHIRKNEFQKARDALIRLGQTDGMSFADERDLGILYQDHLNEPGEAVTAFRRALAIGTESREVRYRIGKALTEIGRHQEAGEEFAKALAPVTDTTGPDTRREKRYAADATRAAAVHEAIAELAHRGDDIPAALSSITRARELDSTSVSIAKTHATLMCAAGRAVKVASIALDPDEPLSTNAEYLFHVAGLLEEAGLSNDLLATLRHLREVALHQPGLTEKLIHAEARYGEPLEAARMLGALGPERAGTAEFAADWEHIMRHELARGNMAKAEEMLRSLSSTSEDGPRFAAVWCELLCRRGEHDQALAKARLVLSQRPDAADSHLLLSHVLRSMGRSREARESAAAAARLGARGAAEYEMGMMAWSAGLPEAAAAHFAAARSDPKLPAHMRKDARRYLAILEDDATASADLSPVEEHIQECLLADRDDKALMLRQIHFASYGIARAFIKLSGDSGAKPAEDEIAELSEIRYAEKAIGRANAFDRICGEYDRAVAFCAASMRRMLSQREAAAIDRIVREYEKASPASAPVFVRMAYAARAQVAMLEAWLSGREANAELAIQVRMALARMKSRQAISSRAAQVATSSDCALAELALAAIRCGPDAPAYEADANAAMEDLTVGLRAASDPLAQMRASRVGAYSILQILVRQILEKGSVSSAADTHGAAVAQCNGRIR